jgi:hypothetical protein
MIDVLLLAFGRWRGLLAIQPYLSLRTLFPTSLCVGGWLDGMINPRRTASPTVIVGGINCLLIFIFPPQSLNFATVSFILASFSAGEMLDF